MTRDKESRAVRSVVVLHEDGRTRQEAVRFCDHLVRHFWATSQFDVNWWSLSQLEQQPSVSGQAVEKAAAADLILFALEPDGTLTPEMLAWIENWINQRSEREGALVALMDPAAEPSGRSTEKYMYLRQAAHRAGMDYLTHLPADLPHSIPDSLEYCSERAGQITSVLDEILRRAAPLPQQAL